VRLIHSTDTRSPEHRREQLRRERQAPQVVRCACAVCGTHTNALKTFRITGSCANCGSFDLMPIDGAAPLDGPVAA
jgi:hypothetical protein